MVQDNLNTVQHHPKAHTMRGLMVAPKWWSNDSTSRQWILALTGSWNMARSRLKWRLMAAPSLLIGFDDSIRAVVPLFNRLVGNTDALGGCYLKRQNLPKRQINPGCFGLFGLG